MDQPLLLLQTCFLCYSLRHGKHMPYQSFTIVITNHVSCVSTFIRVFEFVVYVHNRLGCIFTCIVLADLRSPLTNFEGAFFSYAEAFIQTTTFSEVKLVLSW